MKNINAYINNGSDTPEILARKEAATPVPEQAEAKTANPEEVDDMTHVPDDIEKLTPDQYWEFTGIHSRAFKIIYGERIITLGGKRDESLENIENDRRRKKRFHKDSYKVYQNAGELITLLLHGSKKPYHPCTARVLSELRDVLD